MKLFQHQDFITVMKKESNKKIVYVTVLLKPLGGLKQKYKMQEEN